MRKKLVEKEIGKEARGERNVVLPAGAKKKEVPQLLEKQERELQKGKGTALALRTKALLFDMGGVLESDGKRTAIGDAIAGLAAEGYLLGVVTNYGKKTAMEKLEQLGIDGYFGAVLTVTEAPPKPEPKILLMALERLGVQKGEAIFFGDTETDLRTGVAAGVRTIKADADLGAKGCAPFFELIEELRQGGG